MTGDSTNEPQGIKPQDHLVYSWWGRAEETLNVGFGRRAQWYRNIEADPQVTIQTAAGAESAIARRVTDGDELLAGVRSPMLVVR